MLLNRFALAGKQALVHERVATHHRAVCGHLVTVPEQDDVIPHDALYGQLHLHTVAHDANLFGGEDGEAVNHALGADLLHDAHGHVEEHDPHEGHVAEPAGEQHEDGKKNVYAIEEREGVLGEDLSYGLGLEVSVGVGETRRDTLRHLFVR